MDIPPNEVTDISDCAVFDLFFGFRPGEAVLMATLSLLGGPGALEGDRNCGDLEGDDDLEGLEGTGGLKDAGGSGLDEREGGGIVCKDLYSTSAPLCGCIKRERSPSDIVLLKRKKVKLDILLPAVSIVVFSDCKFHTLLLSYKISDSLLFLPT